MLTLNTFLSTQTFIIWWRCHINQVPHRHTLLAQALIVAWILVNGDSRCNAAQPMPQNLCNTLPCLYAITINGVAHSSFNHYGVCHFFLPFFFKLLIIILFANVSQPFSSWGVGKRLIFNIILPNPLTFF